MSAEDWTPCRLCGGDGGFMGRGGFAICIRCHGTGDEPQ